MATDTLRDLNILFDPLSELGTALQSNAFGITSYALDTANSFPCSEEDRAAVLQESTRSRHGVQGVCARAKVVLLDSAHASTAPAPAPAPASVSSQPEGDQPPAGETELGMVEVVVLLDHRGFTVEDPPSALSTHRGTTYETIESLLIAFSPRYGEAMTHEVSKRFTEPYKPRWQHDDDE